LREKKKRPHQVPEKAQNQICTPAPKKTSKKEENKVLYKIEQKDALVFCNRCELQDTTFLAMGEAKEQDDKKGGRGGDLFYHSRQGRKH